MGGFEFVEHTADLGVVAHGGEFAEALAQVATGMFSVIAELDAVGPSETVQVSVNSSDREALVVDWLNELLYRYEADGFLPREFHVSVGSEETALEATCLGEPADPERHGLRPAVKAATYHGLKVSHDGEWRIDVVLDI